jgi:hypothetical protein
LGPSQNGYSSIIGRYSSKLLQDWGYSTARTEPHSSNIGTLKPPYLPSPANTYRGGYVSSYRQIRFELGNVFRTARSHFAGTQPNDIISSKSQSIQNQPQRSPFCETGLADSQCAMHLLVSIALLLSLEHVSAVTADIWRSHQILTNRRRFLTHTSQSSLDTKTNGNTSGFIGITILNKIYYDCGCPSEASQYVMCR